jgi:acetyltransferase
MMEPRQQSFERLFDPRGIAIVGASGDVTRFGGQTVRALNTSGYAGGVFPVNPKYAEIDGRRCYASIAKIDGPCDLAVIALPAAQVPAAVRQCGQQGIRFAVVLGGGFREMGEQGARLEADMLRAAREESVRLVGPNCIGLVNVHARVIAAFGSMTRPPKLQPGPVSVAVQSGGFGMSVVIRAAMRSVGFRHIVASGSESDITMPELIDAYVDDPETRTIFAYIEGVANGRALMAALRRALVAGKPVVIWKGGKTGQGARAAQSHTANLTSTYDIYRTALRQCGAVEVSDADQAVDFLLAYAPQRLPGGRNVAVVTNTGGSAVVFCDAADSAKLTLATLSEATRSQLKSLLPPLAAVDNPIDTTAGYPRPEHEANFRSAFEAILTDPDVHQLCVLFGTIMGPTFELSARVLADAAGQCTKPVTGFSAVPCEISSVGHEHLQRAGIALFDSLTRAAGTMGLLADYAEARRGVASADSLSATFDLPALPVGPCTLDEHESKRVLAAAGIPVTADRVLALEPEAASLRSLAYPVVLKILSPDIVHKSDIGAVRLGIGGADALAQAAAEMLARVRESAPGAQLSGLLACEMVTDGVETIVGALNDESFGPVITFGMGGVLAETLRDVSYRIAPFGIEAAHAMISELRAHEVFKGVRGRPPCDVAALAHALVRISELAWTMRDRLAELDVNPLLVRPRGRGVAVADALLILR